MCKQIHACSSWNFICVHIKSSQLMKHQDKFISYLKIRVFFIISILKKVNSSRLLFQFTEAKLYSIIGTCTFYLNLKLTVKIIYFDKELCDNWTLLVHPYDCPFCYCSGVHTRLHHGQHVPSTAVWGRKYFCWSRKGKLCPYNRWWLDQIPGWFNQGILLLLFFFNYM